MTKLAGPVVLPSASLTNSTPRAFSWRWISRMSVNDSRSFASLSHPGLNVSVLLVEHALEEPDDRIAVLEDEPVLRDVAAERFESEFLVEVLRRLNVGDALSRSG